MPPLGRGEASTEDADDSAHDPIAPAQKTEPLYFGNGRGPRRTRRLFVPCPWYGIPVTCLRRRQGLMTTSMGVDTIRSELLGFVCRTFIVDASEIDLDRSLVDQGVIDSFGLVEITAFIEQRFGVTVLEEEMTREKFGSLNKMARFVAERLKDAA